VILLYIFKVIGYLFFAYTLFIIGKRLVKKVFSKYKGKIYIQNYVFIYGIIMSLFCYVIFIMSFTIERIKSYELPTLLGGIIFILFFGTIGFLLTSWSSNWELGIQVDRIIYSNFIGIKKEIKVDKIESLLKQGKGIIYIYYKDKKMKIHCDYLAGNTIKLFELIKRYQ